MRVETLMVHQDTSPESEERLALAASMARGLGAGLIGVAAGRAVGAAERTDALLAQAAEVEQLLEVVEERFARTAANLDDATWRSDFVDALGFLAQQSRVADVVIVGPRPRGSGLTVLSIDPEDALIETGRPILYSPTGVRGWVGEHVLVAWKDCKESRRAAYEALPLLARAKAVTVLALNEDDHSDGVEDVVAWLDAHGVAAEAQTRFVRFGTVGDEIIASAGELGADLIVAGSFSRSRGQERVFGGVTLDLLAKSTTPVLFAH
jgi:nucleotide-binding universal stress UspA family protein